MTIMNLLLLPVRDRMGLRNLSIMLAAMCKVVHHISLQNSMYNEEVYPP